MIETFEFLGFGFYAWITIVLVLVMFSLLLFTKLPADVVFVGGMAVLLVCGVLPAREVLSGFSSESVVVVGILFVVVAGLIYTGVLQWIVHHLLGNPSSYPKAIIRLMLPVAMLSSMLSNTTVVALFINVVKMWSKKLGVSPSRLLIPLSYASGMGGVCTLIGTPPNLIISGFYMQETGVELGIFTTTLPGLFCLAVGILSMIALRKLLPDRKSSESSFESISDYTVELLVPTTNPMVGQSVGECGLMDVRGGRLVEIVRFDKEIISPVHADEFVIGGDRLVYSGQIDSILDLRETHHLVNATHHVYSVNEVDERRKLQTGYLEFGSDLIGKRIADTRFEEDHDVVLVAVARQGKRLEASPREIALQAGDTLLLEGKKLREKDFNGDVRFFDSEDIQQVNHKTLVSSGIMLAMVLLSAFHVMPLLNACFWRHLPCCLHVVAV